MLSGKPRPLKRWLPGPLKKVIDEMQKGEEYSIRNVENRIYTLS
jgi:hypothetical protein